MGRHLSVRACEEEKLVWRMPVAERSGRRGGPSKHATGWNGPRRQEIGGL